MLQPGRRSTNSVALLQHGKIVTDPNETLLPTYDVFDEDRYFEPARKSRWSILAGHEVRR